MKLEGMRGSPDVCVARSLRSIARGPTFGAVTPSGRSSCTGWSRRTTPSAASDARSTPVNTLLTEPIS